MPTIKIASTWAVLIVLVAFSVLAQEPVQTRVWMHTDSGQASVGDRVSVTFHIAGARDVSHVPFHVLFDARVLRFDSAEEGSFLDQDGKATTFAAAPTSDGKSIVVGLSRLGKVRGIDGDGELCTVHFTAIAPGAGALAFSRAKIRDSTSKIGDATFRATSIEVR